MRRHREGKRLAVDLITAGRGVCALFLLVLPMGWAFDAVYLLGGLSDVSDGFLARRLRVASRKGAIADGLADLLFLGICLVRFLPAWELPSFAWGWMGAVALVRFGALLFGRTAGKQWLFPHTRGDKITGLSLFVLPFAARSFSIGRAVLPCLILASIAAAEEWIWIWIAIYVRKGKLMVFRKAENGDREKILALYRSAIGGEYCTWNEYYPSELEVDQDLSAGTLFVLSHEEELAGAISVVPENELDGLSEWQYRNAREIARAVIAPQYQGKKLSHRLLNEIEMTEALGDCEAIHLLVARKNLPAVALYRRAGYSFLGETQMYGNDYYVCEKRI